MSDVTTPEPEVATERATEETSNPRQSSVVFWLVVVAAIVVVVVGVVFSQRFGTDPTIIDSPVIGQPAPGQPVPFLDGPGEFSLDSLEGDIVVVNFWASWCLSCRVEHGDLLAAARDLQDVGVTFVAVNHQDQQGNAYAFLDELGWSPETVYVVDDESRLALEFGVLGLPETFFIDRDGTIVGKASGAVTYGFLMETVETIVLGEEVGAVKTGEIENRDS